MLASICFCTSDSQRIHQVAVTLTQRLQLIDPENRPTYQGNWVAFGGRWQKAIESWQQQAKPLRGTKTIVHHREWTYLLDWLGINRVGSLEPNPGVPPTPGHLAKLTKMENDLIIASPLNDPKPAH